MTNTDAITMMKNSVMWKDITQDFKYWNEYNRDKNDDDHPFVVLTETKFSFRCIPVGIGTLLTGLGLKKNTC